MNWIVVAASDHGPLMMIGHRRRHHQERSSCVRWNAARQTNLAVVSCRQTTDTQTGYLVARDVIWFRWRPCSLAAAAPPTVDLRDRRVCAFVRVRRVRSPIAAGHTASAQLTPAPSCLCVRNAYLRSDTRLGQRWNW